MPWHPSNLEVPVLLDFFPRLDIELPELDTQRMAQASLDLARERFDVHKVNAQLLEEIDP